MPNDEEVKLVHYNGDRAPVDVSAHLRRRLVGRMVQAGEPKAEIAGRLLYP